ncbi:MAG: metallophosphoesterase family protein [Gammaproteobacteria bacterium]
MASAIYPVNAEDNVELIGSIDGDDHYCCDQITAILFRNRVSLVYGSEFVGRPETRIHSGDSEIVKIRAELSFDRVKARRWIRSSLEKERELAVHHPFKTWFVLDSEEPDGEHKPAVIGNICPRLQPVHTLLEVYPDSEPIREHYHDILKAVFTKYLGLAKRLNLKLDEGLSNFGVDSSGAVFYIDDEYYPWDNFISFAVMLGVYIRTFSWLDRTFVQQLAATLAELIDSIFDDSHCKVIIAEQLRSLFMPNEEKKGLVLQMVDTLLDSARASRLGRKTTPVKTESQRNTRLSGPSGASTRYLALLADIHANYPALEKVLAYLEAENIQEGIILGDIVGYGPDPVRCIERLEESPFAIIKGNHDHAVAIDKAENGFSQSARTVVKWTVGQLSDEHREWLNCLPAVLENPEWLAVHGAPLDPAFFYGYVYLMTAEDNLDYLQTRKRSLCFHGHSHIPGIFARDNRNCDHHLTDTRIRVDRFDYTLACPGSVGQPRNGNRGAQFAIYDRQEQELHFVTLEYDVGPVIERMREQNLPDHLWQRLLKGK